MHDSLRDYVNSQPLVDPESRAFTYGDGPGGSKPIRAALAKFLNDQFHPVKKVHPDQLMVTNGVSTAIEHCAWALASPGEGVLLGRPYYRAFLPDVSFRTGAKVVSVPFGKLDPLGPECVEEYERALLESNAAGVKIRALILCHPHNPLGRCYSRDTIVGLMKMCQKYGVHLISDEIYALSVFENTVDKLDSQPVGFQSVLSIDTTGIIDPELVHVLWGTSKDFGANGLRLGAIISQANDAFLGACRSCSIYSYPSSLTENAITNVLNDKSFVDSYVQENRKQLSAAHAHAANLLNKYEIPYESGVNAAFFLWVDLGKKFRERHPDAGRVDGEEKDTNPHAITGIIFRKLMQHKVFLVHGEAAGAEEPGWFRLVFTQSPEIVEEGIKRIADAVL